MLFSLLPLQQVYSHSHTADTSGVFATIVGAVTVGVVTFVNAVPLVFTACVCRYSCV